MKKIMNIRLLLCVCLCALMLSCADHDDAMDQTYTAGNVLLSDGRVVSASAYDGEIYDAVGVIFHQTGDSVFVVSLKEQGNFCFSDSLFSVSGVSSDINSLDGRFSTIALVNSGASVPAATAAYTYDSKLKGWHLPSAGELRMLALNRSTVARTLDAIGGDGFSGDQYLSSSQDGTDENTSMRNCYTVSLGSGAVTSVLKTEKHRVRPVLLIEL